MLLGLFPIQREPQAPAVIAARSHADPALASLLDHRERDPLPTRRILARRCRVCALLQGADVHENIFVIPPVVICRALAVQIQ